MSTVNMINPNWGGGTINTGSRSTPPTSGSSYTPDASGYVANVAASDIGIFLNSGFSFAARAHRQYNSPGAPAAASAAVTVASTSLSAGSLSIAAQPDVPRQLQVVVGAGSLTLSAGGNLALTYSANDGTTQTDNLAYGGIASSATETLTTTKGVEHLTSVVNSAVPAAAAANSYLFIGTNGVLGLPVDTGFASTQFSVNKETKITATAGTLGLSVPADETVGTVTASGALVAPTTAPDGTHQFSFEYSYAYPG